MMTDAHLLFSDEQSLAINVGTALSDKSIDLGASATDTLGNTVISDIGRGTQIEVFCQITTAVVASGGSATLQVELVMADDEALSTNLVVLHATAAIAKTVLVAGYQFRLGGTPPPGVSSRYLGLRYTVATANIDSGNITAGLVKDRQSNPKV